MRRHMKLWGPPMRKSLLSVSYSVAVLAFACGINTPAQAQVSMDYGALQELFGEPVTTSATGTPQRASEVATTMTIITADEIKHASSRSIPQIIGELVPGMDIMQTSATAFEVGARGYQQPMQPRFLVLIDGRQVFVDDYSRTVWDNLPINIDDVRQIEVVKGPASALFGSNAAGGVVNIVTYSPLYDNSNAVTVGLGSQNTVVGDAVATAKLGSFGGIKLTAGGMNGDDFHTSREVAELATYTNPQHRYITQSSVFQLAPNVQANTELTYAESKGMFADYADLVDRNDFTTYSARVGFGWQTPYGQISNNTYLNHAEASTYTAPAVALGGATDLIVSSLEDQFKLGVDHSFRVALEYRHKTFTDMNGTALLAPSAPRTEEDVFTGSGTWVWHPTEPLTITNALRLDHVAGEQTGTLPYDSFVSANQYGHDVNALSVNSAVNYKVDDFNALRLSYGRGIQLPSLVEYGFNFAFSSPSSIYSQEGNPNLKPTIVQNYEIGYDRKLPALDSTAKFSVYYQINQDIVAETALPVAIRFVGGPLPIATFQEINVGNSEGWGGELELQGTHPLGFRWDTSYSYSSVADSQTVKELVGYDKSTPTHHLRLSLGYTTGKWDFDGHGQLVTASALQRGSLTSTYNIPTPVSGYASLGGRIGYNIRDTMTLAVMGTNVTNAVTVTSPYPAVERQVLVSLTNKF